MQDDLKNFVDRIDGFGDESKRVLVSLTADGLRDTETWSSLDPERDLDIQHAALAKRLHRLAKIRVRHYLNGLALACSWQAHCNDLWRCVTASGFDPAKLYFRGVFELVAIVDLQRCLATCCEEARLAGFISVGEVDQLAKGETIAAVLDPRPADVPIGPPIVMTERDV